MEDMPQTKTAKGSKSEACPLIRSMRTNVPILMPYRDTDMPTRRRKRRSVVRARQALEVPAFEFVQQRVGEHLVGNRCDLLGFLPGRTQRFQLAQQRATLDVLVGCHLERQTIDGWQTEERRMLLASRPTSSPKRTVG